LSLQFHPATGYFSMIPGRAIRAAALMVVTGCATRERLTFEPNNPAEGPTTELTQPGLNDTTLVAGDLLLIQGRSYDPDGVDTVYVVATGGNQSFAPILGQGRDTVPFAVELSTAHRGGTTVLVQAFGVDDLGTQGSVVSRQIHIE
jgi:hypothetical protein